jgi:hypothetical protein
VAWCHRQGNQAILSESLYLGPQRREVDASVDDHGRYAVPTRFRDKLGAPDIKGKGRETPVGIHADNCRLVCTDGWARAAIDLA